MAHKMELSKQRENIVINNISKYQEIDCNIVIDKIIDRQDTEDGVKIYIRDIVNEEKEDENKELTKEEFIGIYKFRIPKIAFPTIWFKDFIGGDA